jgi:transketolase
MKPLKAIFFQWVESKLKNQDDIYLLALDLGFPEITNLLKRYPDRVINMGVAEQNALLVACGLSLLGAKVYIYGISSFTLWRAAEILHLYSKSLQNVVIIGNGGGLGYGMMGESHHSIRDYGLLNLIKPQPLTYLPLNSIQLIEYLEDSFRSSRFQYFRLINPHVSFENFDCEYNPTVNSLVKPTKTVVIVGPTLYPKAQKDQDTFYITHWPSPFSAILESASQTKHLVIYEEHIFQGSVAQILGTHLAKDIQLQVYCLMDDEETVGTRDYLLNKQLKLHSLQDLHD